MRIVISIHALPAEGDVEGSSLYEAVNISIHALPAEGDIIFFMIINSSSSISIHALPAEGDTT